MENITIAMLDKKRNSYPLVYAFACFAKVKGVNFFYFTPEDINYEAKTIIGKTLEDNNWVEREFQYPDYIYDRLRAKGRAKAHKQLYTEFENIPFNNYTRGGSSNKSVVYKKILNGGRFKENIIPYEKINNEDTVITYLHKYNQIICKSETGRAGMTVYFIESVNSNYKVTLLKETKILNYFELMDLIKEKMLEDGADYIVQPFIKSTTLDGNPFDLRAHMMKDGTGKWSIVKIYPRIGSISAKVSNLHLGGSTCELKNFLAKHIFVDNIPEFRKKLQKFSIDFANYFEGLLDDSLSEMGLDIAVDENLNIWLFEVNTNDVDKMNLKYEAADFAISYGKYVVEQSRK